MNSSSEINQKNIVFTVEESPFFPSAKSREKMITFFADEHSMYVHLYADALALLEKLPNHLEAEFAPLVLRLAKIVFYYTRVIYFLENTDCSQ